MDSGRSTEDPGQPGTPPGVSVHGGAVEPPSATQVPAPPLATDEPLTITLSDLKKMVGVVEASVVLWNELERTVLELARGEMHPTWFNEWALLRDALDKLEVPSE